MTEKLISNVTETSKPAANPWPRRLGLAVVVVGLAYFITALMRHSREMPPLRTDGLALGSALFAIAVVPLTVSLVGIIWRALMRDQGVHVGVGAAVRIVAVSQIGKYLPGNVGHFLGRAALARAAGLPLGPALGTSLLEVLWTLALGFGLATITLVWLLDRPLEAGFSLLNNPGVILLLGVASAILPWPAIAALNRWLPGVARRLGNNAPIALPRPVTALFTGTMLLGCFGLLGLSVTAQLRALLGVETGGFLVFTLLFSTAWVAGYVVPGAPGGLGVREGLLLVLFSPVIGPGPAVALGISTRLLTTIGDGVAFAVGLAGQHRRRLKRWLTGQPGGDYAVWCRRQAARTVVQARHVAERLDEARTPVISVLLPVCDPPMQWLDAAVASVRNQSWPHWQLCIADDASSDPAVRARLSALAAEDDRIRVSWRTERGHIVAASNSARALAEGDWVVLLDHDDCLDADALLWLAAAIQDNPGWRLVYSDEDQIDGKDRPQAPFFKPDWSPHLAVSQAYLGHMVALERALLEQVGGFDAGVDGAQDYALWLKAAQAAGDAAVGHIPRVLYHWRVHAGSTAQGDGAKPYAEAAGRKAVAGYVRSRYPSLNATVEAGEYPLTYRLAFAADPSFKASIIIPTRDQLAYLRPCVESILEKTRDIDFEIIIVDNGSSDPQTLAYLADIDADSSPVRVIRADMAFNWSAVNNLGAEAADGEVLVFLNNDTEVLSPDWLLALAGYAALPDVGVAGGLLFYPDGTLQHSGVVLGMGGWADHVFKGAAAAHPGVDNPFVSPVITRNVLAVTGACMAVRRSVYDAIGGLDEAFLICGSDVAFALAARKEAGHNVLVAEARLTHHESKSRSPVVPAVDFAQSRRAYAPYRLEAIDPCFNPNLSLKQTWPTVNTGEPRPAAGDAQATSIG
ncbi:glycosyltransferase [Spiribacter pallidus]|uniref:glycosyltransferase n=1 Tax=Spiribacter pallidus TaxID=1987936 RepID=UPI0034A07F56